MRYSSSHYALVLYELLKKTDDAKDIISKFVSMLDKQGKLGMYRKIALDFERIWNEKEGITEVNISSATPINAENLLSSFKEKVELKTSTDKSLIGGMKIKVGDVLIDNTIKSRINRLKNTFAK